MLVSAQVGKNMQHDASPCWAYGGRPYLGYLLIDCIFNGTRFTDYSSVTIGT